MIPINKQQPQKAERHPLGWLWVHSIFYTIQGEGPFVGRPAVFIRLAGCNLQCPGCDTEYTQGAQLMTPTDIVRKVEETENRPLIVITGGEPFRQNLCPFITVLRARNYRSIQIETNGTMWDRGFAGLPLDPIPYYEVDPVTIVCSPKAGKIAIPGDRIMALKYVVSYDAIDERDGLPTSVLGMPAAPARPPAGFRGPIYVQPADGGTRERRFANHLNMDAAIASCMKFGYTLCIQTHKILGLE